MRKLIRSFLSNRMIIGGILLLIQLLTLVSILVFITDISPFFYVVFYLLSMCTVLWLVRKTDNPAYKISWIILIFSFPVLGGFFYLIWGNTPLNKSQIKKLSDIDRTLFDIEKIAIKSEELSNISKDYTRICNYLENTSNFPAFRNSNCEYFDIGETFHKSLLENLEKAEKFIFMEYFIVEEGIMWDSILKILQKKAENGVEIRFMYDDAGCLGTLPSGYHNVLESFGIKCVRFNPFKPTLHTYLNHRDHRKICVIDGKIGYMGGINLADEYINKRLKFGHWKDNALLMQGDAVTSLSMMFLELWEFATGENSNDYSKYLYKSDVITKGFIQPFSDSPLDNLNIGENVYMQIINTAKDYVYIMTPYLILDNEMITSLIISAQSGIDVRILTPHIPDKKYVHPVTRSYYHQLLESGVRIFEYTPGFIHGKIILSDDKVGVLGTINMDFRSFYMHFECGTLLYDCSVLDDIKADFLDTLSKSQEITIEEMQKTPKLASFIHSILRLFSPMM